MTRMCKEELARCAAPLPNECSALDRVRRGAAARIGGVFMKSYLA
jgi:hypothetical protein